MVAYLPFPIDDAPVPMAHDQVIPFRSGLLIEFREAVRQRDDKIHEMERDLRMLRQRLTQLEREAEETSITLEQHDDRLDTLEFTGPVAAGSDRVMTGSRILVAQPIDSAGTDSALAELHQAMRLIVDGMAIYRRHGVDLTDLMRRVFPLFAAAAEQFAADSRVEKS